MTKAQTIDKLEVLLEDTTSDEFLILLANYMSAQELSEFLEFVELEKLN